MVQTELSRALYRFVARLAVDGHVGRRMQEHADLLKQELEKEDPTLPRTLPNYTDEPPHGG